MKRTLWWPATLALWVVCSAVGLLAAAAVIWATILLSEPDGFFRTPFCLLNPNCPLVVPCGWGEGCEVINFIFGGVAQMVGLAIVLAAILFVTRLTWQEDDPSLENWREGVRRNAIIWAFGVAIIALVDLVIYIVVWVRWAHCRVEHYQEQSVFPTRQVWEGAIMAVVVAGAAIALAQFLRRRERRDRASSPASAAEV
ncbi:MAG: hypothetical protein JW722_00730 [Demequinaceae bacterium]|nr:hypothetical protein [Demequinaceae bacterium]